MMMKPLIDANLVFLEQALALVGDLDPRTYSATVPGLSSAGAHLRHILDHYAAFCDGVPAGAVDYDQRNRDAAVERDPQTAAAMTRELMSRLSTLPESGDGSLTTRMDCGSGVGPATTRSSVERELQFLVSHTVHHFALIKAVLTGADVRLPDDFGVAPSTLAYRAGSACAP